MKETTGDCGHCQKKAKQKKQQQQKGTKKERILISRNENGK